jgi:methylenetetrahydrofolate--tRNA-(uracil-5-)-methyltransferase
VDTPGQVEKVSREALTIIGGGLAGCEAAWQAVRRGIKVTIYEMKPERFSPAHRSSLLAELVCSNSLKATSLENASGLLKEELRGFGSIVIEAAEKTRIPAGSALAVDREEFSRYISSVVAEECTVIRREVKEIPEGISIIATGPLTSPDFTRILSSLTREKYLYFYDAISPIIEKDSIDFSVVFPADRYGKGEADYLNCPLSREEYYHFIEELLGAEKVPSRDFENLRFFEGCLPIEVLAERGKDTLAFGPMKPVGLNDPRTGSQPFAVVQLRQEDKFASLYNMVGFQTKLTHPEQERVFRLIPGLNQARFARLGSLHRNTFINSPLLLNHYLQFKEHPSIFLAGQLTGVEGYVESTAMGLLAGINAARLLRGESLVIPPATTAIGSLLSYIIGSGSRSFQPMSINFGLFPPLKGRPGKKERKKRLAERALKDLEEWKFSFS